MTDVGRRSNTSRHAMTTLLPRNYRLAAHEGRNAAGGGFLRHLLTRIAHERSDGAFRCLFEEFRPRLRNYMTREGVDFATAEDLAQETLFAVWRKAGMYSCEKGTPETWMLTIARNLRIDRLRREGSWQQLPDDTAETVYSEEPAPDDAACGRQRQERVQRVLTGLPAEQREVIALAFIDGLSHNEIARQLALPLGTVKSRVRLAYDKVRSALQDLR